MGHTQGILIFSIISLSLCAAQNATDDNAGGLGIPVTPKMFGPLFMGTEHTLRLNISFPFTKDAKIRLQSQDDIVAAVTEMVPVVVNEDCDEDCNIEIEFKVREYMCILFILLSVEW